MRKPTPFRVVISPVTTEEELDELIDVLERICTMANILLEQEDDFVSPREL